MNSKDVIYHTYRYHQRHFREIKLEYGSDATDTKPDLDDSLLSSSSVASSPPETPQIAEDNHTVESKKESNAKGSRDEHDKQIVDESNVQLVEPCGSSSLGEAITTDVQKKSYSSALQKQTNKSLGSRDQTRPREAINSTCEKVTNMLSPTNMYIQKNKIQLKNKSNNERNLTENDKNLTKNKYSDIQKRNENIDSHREKYEENLKRKYEQTQISVEAQSDKINRNSPEKIVLNENIESKTIPCTSGTTSTKLLSNEKTEDCEILLELHTSPLASDSEEETSESQQLQLEEDINIIPETQEEVLQISH